MASAIISANLFAAKVLFVKLAYAEGSSPLQILFIRMAAALPFFLGITVYLLWKYPERRPTSSDYLGMAGLGMIGYYLSSLLDFHGIQHISAGMERLLLYLYPSFLVLLRSASTQSLPSQKEVLSLFLAYMGAGLVYYDEQQLDSANLFGGSLLVIGAALSFAIYLFFSAGYIKKYGSRLFASFSTTISCFAILLHGAILPGDISEGQTSLILVVGISMGLLCTVLPTFAMHQAISMIGSTKVGMLGTTGLLCPLVLGIVLFGEPLTITRIVGAILVLLSVISLSRSSKNEVKTPAGG
jgi:drug/metabolite transporter (DMT)-like permease